MYKHQIIIFFLYINIIGREECICKKKSIVTLNCGHELELICGTDKSKLLSATIWLSDIRTFNEMNGVWDAWVAPNNTPARACVEARLAAPQFTAATTDTATPMAAGTPTSGVSRRSSSGWGRTPCAGCA